MTFEPDTSTATRVTNEIQSLLAKNDAASLKQAALLSRVLPLLLEAPEDTAVQLSFMPLQVLCARLAIDLRLFKIIAEHGEGITSEKLASKSGGEELLIIRILRVLSLVGFVTEVSERKWSTTPVTFAMTKPAIEGSHKHLWDMTFNTAAKIPEYMQKNGYKSPTSFNDGPLQYALQTDLACFEYCSSKPSMLDDFNNMMTGIRHSRPSWVQWFPVKEQILNGYREGTTLLVDVGGGWGHDVVAFQEKYALTVPLALQDLPLVTSQVPYLPTNIEVMSYDFLAEIQPVKGARAYFFHFIFHDWPDEKCLRIFRHTAASMTRGYSKILLNEYVLKDAGCGMAPAMMDINMLTLCAGMERTEKQWRELVGRAGLVISRIWRPEGDTEAVIEIEVGGEGV
ncbi:S-adenosyl-L-methionine-dependent methyltransferase [Glarea lozoyensis ATCC 20868]|uniref:S-adenosyl-L-methionine-dependent methyltransferase n=1 Tax=Glarea lozoyensis (strain ATCC 20868 / MF5171) TaxID=1116229 RepID=S3DPI2_GLAL2|nr:S-adenosyl-L-methionine-dependent methyltransferase [Glarea lozoyensis ATCC 20868]EPE28348.1 S-adenosyl-L-methionine-dependent methyltransferase [Glarea lozoyensis ATCC 20868]